MANKKGQGTERKISEAEFKAFLRNNGGVYSRTAKAITTHLQKVTGDKSAQYTRQAVKYRAEQLSDEELEDIEDETWDLVAGGLQDALVSIDQRIRLEAVKLGLKYLGHKYGVEEHSTQTQNTNVRIVIGNAGSEKKE